MRTRKEILTDLVQNKRDVLSLTKELSSYSWDYDEPLYVITARDIEKALNTFNAESLENWANAIECREDLDFESDELKEIVHEIANPVLFGAMSNERAESLKRQLKSL